MSSEIPNNTMTPSLDEHHHLEHHSTHDLKSKCCNSDDQCCEPTTKTSSLCGDEGCTGCGSDEAQDPDQHNLELEFIFFVRQHYPQEEMMADDRETQQRKLATILERFDEIKEKQEQAAIVLRKQVEIIQQRFPAECDEEFLPFFKAQYWIDNLIPQTKEKFDAANNGMNGPLNATVLPPTEEVCSHVYKVQLYSENFLSKLNNFLHYVEKWLSLNDFDLIPPNSMNRYGVTLEYLGLGEVFVDLCQYFFQSIVPTHYPFILALQDGDEDVDEDHHKLGCCESHGGEKKLCSDEKQQEETNHDACQKKDQSSSKIIFDDVHTFTVQYRTNVDLNKEKAPKLETPNSAQNVSSLSLHTDASHLTLNICLGDDFTDGDLYLRGLRCTEHQQMEISSEDSNLTPTQLAETGEDTLLPQLKGYAYIHTGTLRHGAQPITAGFRQNLIIWAVNSKLRDNMGYFGPCFICATQVVDGIQFVGSDDENGHIDEHGNLTATSSDLQ